MKKLLLLGAFTIAAISAFALDANAWFLPCCRDHCCNKCTTTLCCRPYNAFTPCCFGNINCEGCMPINMGGCCGSSCAPSCFNCCQQNNCCQPNNCCPSYGPGCCVSGNYGDFGCLPAPGSFAAAPQGAMPLQIQTTPTQPVPTAPGPQFVAPNPQMVGPNSQGMNPMSYMVPMQPMQMQPMYGFSPVQPISYNAGYQQPMYNPYYYPQMPMNQYRPVQAPAYWYGR